jgi:cell division septal protein FtsQ
VDDVEEEEEVEEEEDRADSDEERHKKKKKKKKRFGFLYFYCVFLVFWHYNLFFLLIYGIGIFVTVSDGEKSHGLFYCKL